MNYAPIPIHDHQGRAHYPTTITPEMQEAAREAERLRIEAAIEQRKKDQAERARQREQDELERGQAALTEYRERCRASWRASGGTDAEFEREWPRIKADHLRAQVADGKTPQERLVERAIEGYRRSGTYTL